ncbi:MULTISPECIES: 4-hydroxy-tetrahydrodipicolinate reductase [Neobacillus]|jgi:4-hydroxy-tetrahydrodipicolinate reductase|uniref:4-hydroxy-tetrahydrodipicolinate reductase n=1 Tax=Neobacillus sedimentimangrovi TaxID=2699460 RepID=A0ABS8QJ68_9BACI|nr:4-hydroxy-tetrahydrodipicolinate reductase [Neobacillus sedimentimangrovi]AIM15424.1 dihydrodipicolinate reductase [Bacillus sp. X1(2014)]MCD4839303.1 4-hydroxy-tetrahydrodipicolinate reductase [Neobacillus sedimentimangrovi]
METIKIIIAGPRGRMGSEAVKLVENTEHFELIAAVDYKHDGMMLSDLPGFQSIIHSVPVFSDIEKCLQHVKADVLIDLTTPEVGMYHAKTALEYNVRPVVGTTGFTKKDLEELERICNEKELGCIIAPNFAIGAILMMKFSQMAAKYFNDVEIIELHHDQKLDAPSGTAVKTAEMISAVRERKKQGHPNEKETIDGARGALYDGMHIHSVRLPGLIAHQQVLFGADGQTLTIRHDSYHRGSFMSGIKIAVETVVKNNSFVYGLENILD